jgi:excinuclease ABC subunit A
MLAVRLTVAEGRELGIQDLCALTIGEATGAVDALVLSESDAEIVKDVLREIRQRLSFLNEVGLDYLQLNRESGTLSGGEAQRIKLASFLNAGAANEPTLFIFDEPTTGLHFHDVKKLLVAFDELLRNGHSIIVIEHHPDVIKYADHIIDIGPGAGDKGGNIVFEGTPEAIMNCQESKTRLALEGKL